ncbi:MAG TPA: hypothetical protein VHR45_02700 [Thermoanaerobaculia bacterium]|nr:hypothetical protein [Thermoanaerobaculia bacterium]
MKKSLVYLSLMCLLVGVLSLAGCKKDEPPIEETTPAAAPAITEPLGTGMGTDLAPLSTDMGTDLAKPLGTDAAPPK